MPVICRLLCLTLMPLTLALWLPSALPSLGAAENEILSGDEIEDRFRERRREAAASFRVSAREMAASLGPEYHAAGAQVLDEVRTLFTNGDFRQAIRVGRAGYRDYPFAHDAPQLVHMMMRIYAATGAPNQARQWLVDLWERYPGYEHIERAMGEALLATQALRREGLVINHSAEHPRDVMRVRDLRKILAANDLFRFLSRHGDRRDVAPAAKLGLARALLAEGGKKRIFQARVAYDDFLLSYPEHPLVFEALIELAVSHLITYRGPRFDVGVLIDGAHIIDQAELYTREQPERVSIVQHYRQLIRGWHQDRDLYAAEWYEDHRRWDAARYYYQAVVRREATSEAGQKAQRAMEDLPESEDDEPPMRPVDWLRK